MKASTAVIAVALLCTSPEVTAEEASDEAQSTQPPGADGVWTSTFEILQPDATWKQVMEFRMERVGTQAPRPPLATDIGCDIRGSSPQGKGEAPHVNRLPWT